MTDWFEQLQNSKLSAFQQLFSPFAASFYRPIFGETKVKNRQLDNSAGVKQYFSF